MTETALTPEQILEAAEDVLRRFGPAKATVVDVARVLGVSHGSVYRHFPSKAALRDAVTERWLARLCAPLAAVVGENTPAPERLRRWFDLLIRSKRSRALDDPELFATYIQLVAGARDVVKGHVDTLVSQIAQIIAEGVKQGDFTVNDPFAAGQGVFYATARFHDPVHAAEWADLNIDAAFESVWTLLMRGLGAGNP
ncbi:MAG TPA: TetR family transcriptional regulator [Aggregatilineales bacterium]|nr:TetR family transcriptional regulator [Anaerolineales bacterium]HRE46931.1 TetR family transcriptional regulator [Aggregatilineales bacterium]